MPNDLIRYDLLVQEALCGVVSRVLAEAAKNGLPGDHHFYITFRTHAPGVRLSSRMRDAYPEEMTIILQHQFEDLKVTEHAFEVGLSFKGVPEMLLIPFEAMTGFFDPSVQFSLKFEPLTEGEVGEGPAPVSSPLTTPVARSVNLIKPAPLALTTIARDAEAGATPPQPPVAAPAPAAASAEEPRGEPAKVVSIDAFRKKP